MKLTAIIPTAGRATLSRTLASIADAILLSPAIDLEVIVATDGDRPESEAMLRDSGLKNTQVVSGPFVGDWGHTPFNRAIKHATGTHLVFNDDDDVFLPWAFRYILAAVEEHGPDRPFLFRFIDYSGGLIWADDGKPGKLDAPGHVGGHCIVCPNVPEKLGVWTGRYCGDFDFIHATLSFYPPEAVVWRREVISQCRP